MNLRSYPLRDSASFRIFPKEISRGKTTREVCGSVFLKGKKGLRNTRYKE